MTNKKCIKLTVSEDMYNAIKNRAEKLSVSMPAFCCFVIGEKLSQYNLGEEIALKSVKDYTGNLLDELIK